MTDPGPHGGGKMITRVAIYGFISLVLYFLLYFFEDAILEFTSRGGWFFIAPVVIAFVFSYFHGSFTSHFWDALGIKAKK
jgi:hypothetical protein